MRQTSALSNCCAAKIRNAAFSYQLSALSVRMLARRLGHAVAES
jgi:hypothetical protein